MIAAATATLGLGIIVFSRTATLWLSLPLMFVTGAAMMLQMAASNTILQAIVEEDKRGRIMSLFAMAYFATVPFGSLLAGAAATRRGVQNTILAGGVVCVTAALILFFLREMPALRRQVRPICLRMRILPGITDEVPLSTPTTAT